VDLMTITAIGLIKSTLAGRMSKATTSWCWANKTAFDKHT
jgi:hypothetical protein